ncbi:hypothetical protein S83_038116, partial [Arachis hypogaea]
FHLQHKQRKQKAEVEVRSRSPPSRKEVSVLLRVVLCNVQFLVQLFKYESFR